jgi:HSP20 family molecular chaperone IbpA
VPERTRQQTAGTRSVVPTVDVFENEDHILILADMPGVAPDTIDVRLDNAELHINAVQHPPDDPDPSFVPLEFDRMFTVPQTIAPDGVTAELTAGVLHLTLAKSETAKPKRIKVTSG